MSILFYDEAIFQTNRPGLTTVQWKKQTIVDDAPVDVTAWTTEGVTESFNGNYYLRVPIEDTDPDPLLIVADTGEGGGISFSKAILALKFKPESLTEVKSGGGILHARIAGGSLSPEKYLEIIQGEEKVITFIVEADGRFDNAVATSIEVRIQDPRGNKVYIGNANIERVCEQLDIQVIRATITEMASLSLIQGIAKIEISFDDQKARLSHALKIIEDIEVEGS